MVPQVMSDLAVGKGAPVGPELAPTAAVKAQSRLQQPDHCQLAQVIKWMAGAPGEVAGDLVPQLLVRQRMRRRAQFEYPGACAGNKYYQYYILTEQSGQCARI